MSPLAWRDRTITGKYGMKSSLSFSRIALGQVPDYHEFRKVPYPDAIQGWRDEVAHVDAVAAVRDSKNAAGPVVVLPVAGWSAFLSVARHGHFD